MADPAGFYDRDIHPIKESEIPLVRDSARVSHGVLWTVCITV